MQARHPYYKESATQQGVPIFTGEVRWYVDQFFLSASLVSLPTSMNLTRQWRLVTMVLLFGYP